MLFLTETEQQISFDGASRLLDMLLLVMLAMVAVYGLYTVIRLKKDYVLFPNKFIYPSGCTAEDCIDEGGYIDYIIPRLTILSVTCLILAIAYAVRMFVFPDVNHWVIELATLVLPVGILFWYAVIQNKVSKTFW